MPDADAAFEQVRTGGVERLVVIDLEEAVFVWSLSVMRTRGVFWAPLGSCRSAGTPATPIDGVFQITAVVVDTPVSA